MSIPDRPGTPERTIPEQEGLQAGPWASGAGGSDPAERIILALDRPDADSALALVDLIPELRWVKVGLELFTSVGPDMVTHLRQRGLRVFLDLKFHDIPATMAGACGSAARLGAVLITVHACSGSDALAAAQRSASAAASEANLSSPTVLAVTVLTSWDPIEFTSQLAIRESVEDHVSRLAALAARAGIGGVVCSPLEVAGLRRRHPEPFALITPGIRPAWAGRGDQRRVMGPSEAARAGASRLVIGRPIHAADDPRRRFLQCCAELEQIGGASPAG